MWYQVLLTSMKLGNKGVAHVEGVDRVDLKESNVCSNLLLINRTASPLSWFMECEDRNSHSAIKLPYSFLHLMAAKKLRDVADQVKGLLGDYDAIHVRRGDKIKTMKDRFGVHRSLHPHLDRDTRPEFFLLRIKNGSHQDEPFSLHQMRGHLVSFHISLSVINWHTRQITAVLLIRWSRTTINCS